ncbi:MAG: hypothetical protein ACOCQD_04440, partial [archaeon]
MGFSPDMATMLINGAFLLFIVLGFLFGLKRGHKIATLRLSFIVGIAFVMYLIAPMISGWLLQIDFSNILGVVKFQIAGQEHTFTSLESLMDAVIASNQGIQDFAAANPSFESLIEQVPYIFSNLAIFLLGFWILKSLTWPIFMAIAASKFKKNPDGTRQRKKRMLGGGIGIVQGFIIAFVTFIPVAGVSSVLNVQGTVDGETTVLANYLPSQTTQFLPVYEDSILGMLGGIGDMDGKAFDSLTTLQVRNDETGTTTRIRPRHDAMRGISSADKVEQLMQMFKDIENGQRDNVDWDLMEELVDDVFEMDSMELVADDYLPYAVDKILEDEDYAILEKILDLPAGQDIETLVNDFVDGLDQNTLDQYKSDFMAFINIGRSLEEYGIESLLINYIQDDQDIESDLAEEALETFALNKSLVDEITESVLGSHTIKSYLPQSLNVMIGMMEETINRDKQEGEEVSIDRIDVEDIDWSQEARTLSDASHKLIKFTYELDPFNAEDTDDIDMLESANFTNVGEAIDSIKSTTLFENVYVSMIEAVITLDEVQKYDEYVDFDLLNTTLQDLEWEQEFTLIDNGVEFYTNFKRREEVLASDLEPFIASLDDSQVIDIGIDGIKKLIFIDSLNESSVPGWTDGLNINAISDNAEFISKMSELAFKHTDSDKTTEEILTDIRENDLNTIVNSVESINANTDSDYIQEFKTFLNESAIYALNKKDYSYSWVDNIDVDDFIDNIEFLTDMYAFGIDLNNKEVQNYTQADIEGVGDSIDSLDSLSSNLTSILQGTYDDILISEEKIDFLVENFEFDQIDWESESVIIEDILGIYVDYQSEQEVDRNDIEPLISNTQDSYILDKYISEGLAPIVDEEPRPSWVDQAEISWISDNDELFAIIIEKIIWLQDENNDAE